MAKPRAETEIPEDISALSFEAAMRELEEIVRQLEQGKVELEESIRIYERGTALRAHCDAKLKSAQARIDKIVAEAGKAVGTEPADLE